MENNENKSLAVIEELKKNNFDLVPFTPEMKEAIEEELDGIAISFDFVKAPSGGALVFEIPGEDPENPDVVKDITGIIVYHHKVNTRWSGAYDGSNAQPDCFSGDGKYGITPADGATHDCASCPFNQYGSAENGKGKACKNSEHIYIVRSGSPLPICLVVPPSSLKAWQEYLSKTLVLRGKKPASVLTKITLKKETNPAGIVYSKFVFQNAGNLSADAIAYVKPMAESLKAIAQAKAQGGDFSEVSGDEEVPF